MAGQSKMQFLDLDHELIVLIISKTTLLHQFTHRRVSKHFNNIIEDNVWLNCKRLPREEFPGTYYLPMDQICQAMLPKMPHLKKLPSHIYLATDKYDIIIDLASRYCHEVTFLHWCNLEHIKRYVRNLDAHSVPIDHRNFQFYASSNESIDKLRDLPGSIPIVLCSAEIDLSNHPWLNVNRIRKLTCENLDSSSVEIPSKVTKLDSDKLYDKFLDICHNVTSLRLGEDYLSNLKYYDHLSELETNTYSREYENEDVKKTFCDNLESFLLGNGRNVTHFTLRFTDKFDHLMVRIASMSRDKKWRYLSLSRYGCNINFSDNHNLMIKFDGALNWVSGTLSLANNCHRLRFISIYDHFFASTNRILPLREFCANVRDNQLQSWKSMMTTFASHKKNSKIQLKFFVDNPDEDNIISGDNWIITQVTSPRWNRSHRDYGSWRTTTRAEELLRSWNILS